VWQKRHAPTPIFPPNSALACPAAPARASTTPLYAANGVFLPGAWRVGPLGCTPLLFSLAMQRYWNHNVRRQSITLRVHRFGEPLRKPSPQRLDLLEFQQQDSPHHRIRIPRKASRPVEGIGPVPASWAEQRLPLFLGPSGRGSPQTSHTMFGTRSNDERHSSQMGTLLALVSTRSQMRHPEGENTLTTALLVSASQPRPRRRQPRTPPRRAPAMPLDELRPPRGLNSTLLCTLIKEGMYAAVIEPFGMVP
jgi:hypothetical protein